AALAAGHAVLHGQRFRHGGRIASPAGRLNMARLGAFVSGLLFGLGLLLAGMADPAKVLAFLDLAGNWDPSLALVMAGAIGVAALPLLLAGRRSRALLGGTMQLPTRRDVDARLVGGKIGRAHV